MTAAQQHLQTQINGLNERLTEMQSVRCDSDGYDLESQSGNQLTEQPDRGRRKVRRSGSEQRKYREQEMLRQHQHTWYRLSLQPVWTKHTLSTETQAMVTQCSALESQLRSLVRGKGTAAERMVKPFRAALHSFRVLARGHALQSVQSRIHRQLNGGQHSDSMTREYCSGTRHDKRIGLTDYCSCSAWDIQNTADVTADRAKSHHGLGMRCGLGSM